MLTCISKSVRYFGFEALCLLVYTSTSQPTSNRSKHTFPNRLGELPLLQGV